MTKTPDDDTPFSRPQSVDGLPARGATVTIEASEEERRRLAEDLDILTVDALTATFTVTAWGKAGAKLTGTVEGRVKQACVVTLEPVEETVREAVDLTFAPAEQVEEESNEIDLDVHAADPPEPLEGRSIDLGVIAAEHLALGLDPYPRAPDAVFEQAPEEDEAVEERPSPFAKLAALKPRDESR